ncbi:cytochrome c biogenesis protein ResB [Pelosinus propionicus]|uniref:Cytochrome c biogenesis protein n=1 Tax=Pelosinus propionicus DSM 13327 TaxID=1123291 RepID=A0A1I4HW17_9FIRM|nr:cytochrome c biogenesis protein ResB [Pelosinus propionicus]SFL46389.1 cytochrome c biogenesis protein [Pelosinus propionicus DSM 13327]
MNEQDVIVQRAAYKKRVFQILHIVTSMKITMALLMLLAGAAMIGTVISPQRYDIYHSMGFRLLLTLICGSTFICSMKQLAALRHSNKWRHLAPWGTFSVHMAVVLILLGALYGNIYGVSEEINLAVGKNYEINQKKYKGIGEPFALHLENFETQYYSDGTVSDWISHIRIEQYGQNRLIQEVKVNHPLIYHGISIYQSSFGMAIQTQYLDAAGKVLQEASLGEGQGMVLEGDMMILPVRYVGGLNPQIMYIVYKGEREYDWGAASLGSSRFIGPQMGIVKFIEAQPFSGLLIKQDPGIPLVWFGFLLLAFGFFVSLYKKQF